MKGLLVLQRRFAYVGHELAILLKERHGIREFCGYVHERDGYEFLQKQTDVRYSALVLDEEIQKLYKSEVLDMEYLRNFERAYGNLWEFISVDRVIRFGQLVREYPFDTPPYTYEEMLCIAQAYAKRLVAFIEKEKPDFLFVYQPGAMGTLMLCAIAKKKRIPVLYIVPSVTENRVVLSQKYDRLTWVEERFRENLLKKPEHIRDYKEARVFVETFRKKPVMYSAVYSSLIKHGKWKQFDFLSPVNLKRTYSYVRLVFANWNRNKEKQSDYTTVRPFDYFYDRLKRKLRNLIGADDLYDTFDPSKPFVFCPLHYEPELSVLLLSPFDTDQIQIVKRLARSLPAGMYVFVKEHPQMTPYRPRAYYEELKKIPNVKLLRPEVSSFEIIRACALVAIISGAAGWEATIFGKPVITFGEVFYNALPSVAHSRTPDELPALVVRHLSAKVRDEDVIRFVAALLEDSALCDLLHVWEIETDPHKKREALLPFADLIAKKVRLVCTK